MDQMYDMFDPEPYQKLAGFIEFHDINIKEELISELRSKGLDIEEL